MNKIYILLSWFFFSTSVLPMEKDQGVHLDDMEEVDLGPKEKNNVPPITLQASQFKKHREPKEYIKYACAWILCCPCLTFAKCQSKCCNK